MSAGVGDEMTWTKASLHERLIPTASVPCHFAASLEVFKIPVITKIRISGIVRHHQNVVGETHGGYAWLVPPVCEEFYTQWAKRNMEGITYVTMCSLAAEAYAAEKEAEHERAARSTAEALKRTNPGPGAQYVKELVKRGLIK